MSPRSCPSEVFHPGEQEAAALSPAAKQSLVEKVVVLLRDGGAEPVVAEDFAGTALLVGFDGHVARFAGRGDAACERKNCEAKGGADGVAMNHVAGVVAQFGGFVMEFGSRFLMEILRGEFVPLECAVI